MIPVFFMVSGMIAWCVITLSGILWIIDNSIEWFIKGHNLRKEFFAFYTERLKQTKKSTTPTHERK